MELLYIYQFVQLYQYDYINIFVYFDYRSFYIYYNSAANNIDTMKIGVYDSTLRLLSNTNNFSFTMDIHEVKHGKGIYVFHRFFYFQSLAILFLKS